MAEQNDFFSIPEAAAIIGISRIAVFKKVQKGHLTAIRIGRNWAIPAAALQNPLADRREAAGRMPRKPFKKNLPPLPPPTITTTPSPHKDSMDDIGWD